ncbi:MAG: ribonuclease H-like domain-containing protein, partial [Candidatus Kryptoniota bacterium]
EILGQLSLWPLTSRVVAIALLNIESGNGFSLFYSDEEVKFEKKDPEHSYTFVGTNELNMLTKFWEFISKFDVFVTFNGRSFDCPFLMLRSGILGIRPSLNLMAGSRYSMKNHIDLLEELTFHGVTRKFNLDFYCKAFGIESPKSHGITGYDINEYFRARRYNEIAQYCMGDVLATAQLYVKWKYLYEGLK